MMENIKESVMPKSLWAEDPEFAQQCQNVYDYLQKTPFSKAFPHKYKAIIGYEAADKTLQLFEENPNIPLKTVVTTVLNALNDDLSETLVLEITRVIIEEWKELTAQSYADKQVEELV